MRHGRRWHHRERMREHMRAHIQEHIEQHIQARIERHGHGLGARWAAAKRGGRWRHFIAAHLHRRLFMWFGASIFVTVTVASMVHGLVGYGRGHRLYAMLAAGFVLWLISGKIAHRIARPLQELLRVTEEIGAGRLSARARIPAFEMGEIAYLGSAINDMATRIEKQVGDQRELLAGVSHEIRTPLARIRVLLELGRSRGGDAGTFDELEREVVEIDALVGQLLASARLDFADLSVRTLDGADVARRALERADVPEEGVLRIEASPALLSFEGDATLLARALANLLENARRHGGGVTRLGVRAPRAGSVVFDVDDAGPGFPAAGEARDAKERHEGSLGLGLVLVRRIADAHRGRVVIGANPAGRGARVSLELTSPQVVRG
ncbi:MAG TPA: ATP-binding protein [Polyangia bacterium]|nr:ATP-binding protein [Polyangia bacterium]